MDYLKFGNITGFFGVKGWVKIYSLTRPRDNITKYKQFYIGAEKNPIVFEEIKANGKYIVGSIKDIDSREAAAPFIGKDIYVKSSEILRENGEYYWADLIGISVSNKNGELLGLVDHLIETGANDVLVIKNGSSEVLIPFVLDYFIMSIDLDNRKMVVNWELDSEV